MARSVKKRGQTRDGFQHPPVRRLIAVALAGTALVCSLSIGSVGFSAAYDSARDEAIKTTGLIADQKHKELSLYLLLRKERTHTTLERVEHDCKELDELSRRRCVEHILSDAITLVGAEGASATQLGHTFQVGKPAPALPSGERPVIPGSGSLEARFSRGEERFLLVTAISKDGETSLTNRFDMKDVDRIFENRDHLGSSGESFLADPKGFFITPGRYQTAEGSSHPIHTRPMLTCLSGKSGETLDLDYRDTPIIHGYRYVSEIGGGCIMAHIDQQEAFAPAHALRARLALFGALLTLSAMALSVALSGVLARPIDRLLAQLERAVRVREDFLSIASHELKTPLSAIRLREGVIRHRLERGLSPERTTAELNELLRLLERQVPRLNMLIEDLLNVAAIEQEALTISPVRSNLTQAVQEAVSKMSLALHDAGIEVSLAPSPAILCSFDPPRIEQVLFNLLNNAVKYAPGKPLDVLVSSDSEKATVVIRDHGPGIPPDLQKVIFERFERGGSPGSAGGLGLGLYISRHLIEAHGGALRLESTPGQGAAFFIELPLSGT